MLLFSEEFSWVEVMVELLLSLLAQSNHRLRITAIGVFRLLSSSLTPDALQLVLQVNILNVYYYNYITYSHTPVGSFRVHTGVEGA